MNIGTMIIRALGYSADIAAPLAREAVDVAIDRGLKLLADHRPSRVVAREDYMRRAYLFGRMGHRFPEDARAVLGSIGATAYLHEIRSPDAGQSHHSHPWEWAVSIVIAGSYVEEIVTADGSIVERERGPGSVAVINAGNFHRISDLGAPRVWTLFISGPRTLDRAWFFRRPDGSIVHERDYHAHLEAERRAEDAWLESRKAERIYKSTFAGVVEDLQEKLADIADAMEPLTGSALASTAALFGVEQCPGDTDDDLRKRVADGVHGRSGAAFGWWREHDQEPLGQPVMASAGAEARGLEVHADLPPVATPRFDAWRIEHDEGPLKPWPGGPSLPGPAGYTFKSMKSGTIYIRQGANWIGTLTLAGRAVRDAVQLRDDEIEVHAAAWAHARALRDGAA